jgi:PPOX class probable FMN-dependent enzyme
LKSVEFRITSIDGLREIYDQPKQSTAQKVIDHVDKHVAAFIERSPFLLLATTSAAGQMDVSPKGETPGFVKVLDRKTLLFPDRPGNNRIDGLQNIVETGRVGLIFLVPGVRELLRVNGSAYVSTEPELMSRLQIDGKLPRTVTVITVEEAFMHCSRAIIRSNLWDPAARVERNALPSMGTILAAHTNGLIDQCDYDENLPARLKIDLY